MSRRVVVTGLGVIGPVGQTPAEFFDGLVAARSGISPISPSIVPGPNSFVAGQVNFDASAHWPAHQAALFDRSTQFALASAGQAIADAGLELNDEESTRAGVYWGTGLGGATTIEESYRLYFESGGKRIRPTTVVLGMNNAAGANVSMMYGLRGPLVNYSTACSSSATAIGEACRAIRGGYADVIVAGGSEALLTQGNLRGWESMRALATRDPADPSRSCKPFSADRSGIVLGEGSGALVIESEDRARARGARIYAEIVGYGNAADASGISKPDASGQVRAIRAALAEAAIDPSSIGYVNAHGTATPIGDVVETSALRTAFGEHAEKLAVSSTKALHGHLMGGSGAVEMLVAILALHRGVIPPTAHLDRPDPECNLDYVPNVAREGPLAAVMSNSFGFGGMNSVLIARQATP
jgi:3-oxoacyl-[acyl-carrier-protein] synthase II